mmetsp:Transcript_35121/g.99982  ORF Transcript_35121/g.99982 Transcript_35121/m.99982 type:complete len:216 (+) Transcript_35121:741-1388(+)
MVGKHPLEHRLFVELVDRGAALPQRPSAVAGRRHVEGAAPATAAEAELGLHTAEGAKALAEIRKRRCQVAVRPAARRGVAALGLDARRCDEWEGLLAHDAEGAHHRTGARAIGIGALRPRLQRQGRAPPTQHRKRASRRALLLRREVEGGRRSGELCEPLPSREAAPGLRVRASRRGCPARPRRCRREEAVLRRRGPRPLAVTEVAVDAERSAAS